MLNQFKLKPEKITLNNGDQKLWLIKLNLHTHMLYTIKATVQIITKN